jgi:sigma-B regulation protein RsbU (phosphoserine phosphatase)
MLPQQLPEMAGLELATWYEPAAYAGGDYYDFFPLPQGKWGILVGDVSGHGSPAAVLMAITHTLAHSLPFDQPGPGQMLDFVNAHLAHHYTPRHGAFVTAFFGVYCPTSRRMVYASAGHEPPRVMRCADGRLFALDDAQSLPLGVMDDTHFNEAQVTLEPGDQLAIYTDGVTDAMNAQRERFGIKRLEAALRNCALSAQAMIDAVRSQVESFSSRRVGVDDRTMVVVRVEE